MRLHKIADLYVGIDYKYDILKNQAPKYETDDIPEIVHIAVRASDTTVAKLKERTPQLTVPECEYVITGANFYNCLVDFNGLMIHASAVLYKGEAYLFSADSGTGKSTHTQLWLKAFGDEAKILNDDKPAVRIFDDGVYAYGTPWSGKTNFSENAKAKLKGICFIHRSEENSIERVDGSTAVADLLKQTQRPVDADKMDSFLKNIDLLLTKIPIYRMGCNMSVEAALMAYDAMK